MNVDNLYKVTVGGPYETFFENGELPTVKPAESVVGEHVLRRLLNIYTPDEYGFIRFEGRVDPGVRDLAVRALGVFQLPLNSVTALGWDRYAYDLTALVDVEGVGPAFLNREYRHEPMQYERWP